MSTPGGVGIDIGVSARRRRGWVVSASVSAPEGVGIGICIGVGLGRCWHRYQRREVSASVSAPGGVSICVVVSTERCRRRCQRWEVPASAVIGARATFLRLFLSIARAVPSRAISPRGSKRTTSLNMHFRPLLNVGQKVSQPWREGQRKGKR